MTRDQYLVWCKNRALEYLPHDVPSAITSMLSDLKKSEYPDLKSTGSHLEGIGLLYAMNKDSVNARHFIEGFN